MSAHRTDSRWLPLSAIALAAAMLPAAASANDADFTLVNKTGYVIDEVYVSPASATKWGNDITVLLGDFLYIKSMSMALTPDRLDLVRLLCEVTLRMIEGELYQLTRNGVADISRLSVG